VDAEAEFAIGAVVRCEDGECGALRRLIVDPSAHAVTHLVVEPDHHGNKGHLVPIGLVAQAAAREIRLRCTLAQFDALDPAEEMEVRAGMQIDWESQQARSTWRFGPLASDVDGLGPGEGTEPRAVTDENIPRGEGEVSLGQPVHASDGPIGHVDALVTDRSDHRVTHVLLGEGHLWGKKDVAIPVSAVRFVVDDGVYLNLTKEEVGDLPAVGPDRTA
jgi:hypothetical protein